MEKALLIMYQEANSFSGYVTPGYGSSPQFAKKRTIEKFGEQLVDRLLREGLISHDTGGLSKHAVNVSVCQNCERNGCIENHSFYYKCSKCGYEWQTER